MDGHRHVDQIDDASLDREIESLLAVEASPDLPARVRARVAEEPAPRVWRVSWMLATAGAVAAVIAAVIVWPSRQPAPAVAPVQEPRVAEVVRPVTPLPVAPEPPARRHTATARVTPVPAERRAVDIDLPEVIVAENEVKTFAALVASVRQSRFDVAVPAAPDADTPLVINAMPPVEPLEIEPIVKLAARQAEGERP